MGMRDEAPEALEETPPWLVKKDTDKNKIENYYGYTDALYARGDFIPAMDLPGIHAKNKDPRYMTKQNCIDYAKEYYFVDLDPDIGIHKLRGEVRKLRLNPPPPKPEDEPVDPTDLQEIDTSQFGQEDDQAIMDRLWEAGVRPSNGVYLLNEAELNPDEVVDLEKDNDTKIAEAMVLIAKVIDNNQPGWTAVVETEPNVTLDIGTELFVAKIAAAIAEDSGRPEVPPPPPVNPIG